MNPFDLSGKHILITGASSGIGKAIAILCSELGATLTVSGRNEKRLEETFSLLLGSGHVKVAMDLTDYVNTAKMVESFNKFDGVVYCVGTQQNCIAKTMTDSVLNDVFKVNFNSIINLNTLLFENKKINKSASIVFISSVASQYAEVGNAAYSASKGALTAFARVLALENAKRKIRVNTVSPAMVRTPLLKKFDVSEEQFAEDEKKYPLGYSDADDIAPAVTFLLSDGALKITGADIKIDGGLTLN